GQISKWSSIGCIYCVGGTYFCNVLPAHNYFNKCRYAVAIYHIFGQVKLAVKRIFSCQMAVIIAGNPAYRKVSSRIIAVSYLQTSRQLLKQFGKRSSKINPYRIRPCDGNDIFRPVQYRYLYRRFELLTVSDTFGQQEIAIDGISSFLNAVITALFPIHLQQSCCTI